METSQNIATENTALDWFKVIAVIAAFAVALVLTVAVAIGHATDQPLKATTFDEAVELCLSQFEDATPAQDRCIQAAVNTPWAE